MHLITGNVKEIEPRKAFKAYFRNTTINRLCYSLTEVKRGAKSEIALSPSPKKTQKDLIWHSKTGARHARPALFFPKDMFSFRFLSLRLGFFFFPRSSNREEQWTQSSLTCSILSF